MRVCVWLGRWVSEVGSLDAVQAIQQGLDGLSAFILVPYIVKLLNRDWYFKLEHICRVENRLADNLTKLASFDDLLCHRLLAVPDCILSVLQSDEHT
ncbi:hypothetical protein GQ457_02G020860 [Hibiscus cannabinus]